MKNTLIKPAPLRKNAVIGLISPSSPLRDEQKLQRGIRYLESLGYRVECGESVYAREHYLAGSDEVRAQDIMQMFTDTRIDAIFCTRGGYGSMRYLSHLSYRVIKKHPKIFVGFSDITALNTALHRHAKLLTFSGAMVGVDMGGFDAASEEFFWRILT
ncbi:MAG: LD-carboxypeptidase, partial [Candidatus Kapabacteria bacterium]|nr:LD-carboxypeptidase [Candidatus Kapabacteria bacterium]